MKQALRRLLLMSLAGIGLYGQRLLADAPPVTPATSPAVPTIIPNGIVALFGEPQVLFKVLTAAPPGQAALPVQSYLLSVGNQQAGIEVKQIDAQAGTIIFNNHGVIQKLTLLAGTAWSSAQGSGDAGLAVNHLQTPNPHRLIRQIHVAEDPRRQVAPDANQAGTVDGTASFAPHASGGSSEAIPQPGDNSLKPAAPETSDSPSFLPTTQPAGYESSATGDSYEDLTPTEVLARQLLAGGDVPPPPPVTGN